MKTYDSGPRKEKRRHSSLYIPYTYYDCAIPDCYPFVPLHWHNEFEMNYVTEGEGIFRYGDRTVRAGAGDIILTLPNMLHSIQQCGEGKLRYDTLIFSQSALGCGHDERCYTDCISAFCTSGSRIHKRALSGKYLRSCALGKGSFQQQLFYEPVQEDYRPVTVGIPRDDSGRHIISCGFMYLSGLSGYMSMTEIIYFI